MAPLGVTPLLLDSLEFFNAKKFRRKGVFSLATLGLYSLILRGELSQKIEKYDVKREY